MPRVLHSLSNNPDWEKQTTHRKIFHTTPKWQIGLARWGGGLASLGIAAMEVYTGAYAPELIDTVAKFGNHAAQKVVEFMGPVGSLEEFGVRAAGVVAGVAVAGATLSISRHFLDKAYDTENEKTRNATHVTVEE